jgi:beta-N-acetylhexosaminidase
MLRKWLVCFWALPCFASLPIDQMTLEEKIGQLLMVHFNGRDVNQDAETLIQKLHVGGLIYYTWSNGLESPEQVRTLSQNLQKLASIPLLIAVDQEGGIVARLTNGFTIFPGNKALGMTGKPELAQECAFAIGQELLAIGVNMNLAPVIDVNSNPCNPIIGIRSFGDSPQTVAIFGAAALEGYRKAGIITSIKHYPGHGDTEADSHENLPVVNKTIEELNFCELVPFYKLSQFADTVMSAHIMVPALDPDHCATLSPVILNLLREKIEFKGVIISDSLVMEGVLKNCGHSIEEAAIQALNAGCDILMLGGRQLQGTEKSLELTVADVQKIYRALVEAVRTGRIRQERIDQSVQRILNLKNQAVKEPSTDGLNFCAKHENLARQIARLALRCTQNRPIPSIQGARIALFAPDFLQKIIEDSPLVNLGQSTRRLFFKTVPATVDIQESLAAANQADLLIVCSCNAWENSLQRSWIQSVADLQKPFILITLRDPIDALLFPDSDLILSTFSPTAPSIRAASDLIFSQLK